MKRISDQSWQSFSKAHADLLAAHGEAVAIIEDANEKLAAVSERIEAIRAEAYGVMFDEHSDAMQYYEDRSEKWQDSEAGQEYCEWVAELEQAADLLSSGVDLAIEPPDELSSIEDMLNCLDGSFRQGPDE